MSARQRHNLMKTPGTSHGEVSTPYIPSTLPTSAPIVPSSTSQYAPPIGHQEAYALPSDSIKNDDYYNNHEDDEKKKKKKKKKRKSSSDPESDVDEKKKKKKKKKSKVDILRTDNAGMRGASFGFDQRNVRFTQGGRRTKWDESDDEDGGAGISSALMDPTVASGGGLSNADNLSPQELANAQMNQMLAQAQNELLHNSNKKTREIYVGNLAKGQVNAENLKQFLNHLICQLPEFQSKYWMLKECGAVREVRMSSEGIYAFIEMWTDDLAVTAIALGSPSFFNRSMRIGRPAGETSAAAINSMGQIPKSLDITPLQQAGLIPVSGAQPTQQMTQSQMHLSIPTNTQITPAERKLRELYIGNLPQGQVDSNYLRNLLSPACEKLKEYDPKEGPPIVRVDVAGEGRFAFVEFSNSSLATTAMSVFAGLEIFGRKLVVNRPAGYVDPVTGVPHQKGSSGGQMGSNSILNNYSGQGGYGGQQYGGQQGYGGYQQQGYNQPSQPYNPTQAQNTSQPYNPTQAQNQPQYSFNTSTSSNTSTGYSFPQSSTDAWSVKK